MAILILGIVLFMGGIVFLVTSRAGAPWMPTGKVSYDRALALLELAPHDVLADFGAGDGRVLIAAARRYGVRGIGYEVNPILVWLSRVRSYLAGVGERIEIRSGNVFDGHMSGVSAVFIFLMPETNVRVVRELVPRFQSGTRIVSYAFPLPGMFPVREEAGRYRVPIYLYVK